MKLIVVGATGFLGTEVLRQAVARKDITSVVAVTRRALSESSKKGKGGEEEAQEIKKKLVEVVVKDYDQYDDKVKEAFAGAGGCIWLVYRILPFLLR